MEWYKVEKENAESRETDVSGNKTQLPMKFQLRMSAQNNVCSNKAKKIALNVRYASFLLKVLQWPLLHQLLYKIIWQVI